MYRNNVQALADKRRIPNPLREEDLRVAGVIFKSRDGTRTEISATDMNRGARLFLQDMSERRCARPDDLIFWTKEVRQEAIDYFDEIWEDRVEKGRAMLIAMDNARTARILWKK